MRIQRSVREIRRRSGGDRGSEIGKGGWTATHVRVRVRVRVTQEGHVVRNATGGHGGDTMPVCR
jgi:hypothetical protein